jgi:glycosyltransferase involved in cell wall biosynthesis
LFLQKMDFHLSTSPSTSVPFQEAGKKNRDSEKASDSDAYRGFVRRAAGELLAVPDNPLSLLSGSAFRALRPELYEKVRQGQAEFGVPSEQVYDDLVASCALLRRVLWRRLYSPLVRGVKQVLVFLRLMWYVWIVFPLTIRKMRGPPADITLAKLPPRFGIGCESPPRPQASIVVLSYNRLPYLQTTIAAFLETVGDSSFELIAVDNGSRDGSVEFLRGCQQRGIVSKLVLLPENQGISVGYNSGFAVADERSEYVMKLDSDVKILSQGWLAEAIDFLSANDDVAFVALNQVNHAMLRLLPSLRRDGRDLMDFAGWTAGGAMVIPTRVRRELGCFIEDPELRYAPDDIDYYVRASRKGYRAFFLRKVLVYHQRDLDHSDYKEYSRDKPAGQSSQLAIRLAGEYDRGVRPLAVHYEKYERSSSSSVLTPTAPVEQRRR